jgi:hypothetical protein
MATGADQHLGAAVAALMARAEGGGAAARARSYAAAAAALDGRRRAPLDDALLVARDALAARAGEGDADAQAALAELAAAVAAAAVAAYCDGDYTALGFASHAGTRRPEWLGDLLAVPLLRAARRGDAAACLLLHATYRALRRWAAARPVLFAAAAGLRASLQLAAPGSGCPPAQALLPLAACAELLGSRLKPAAVDAIAATCLRLVKEEDALARVAALDALAALADALAAAGPAEGRRGAARLALLDSRPLLAAAARRAADADQAAPTRSGAARLEKALARLGADDGRGENAAPAGAQQQPAPGGSPAAFERSAMNELPAVAAEEERAVASFLRGSIRVEAPRRAPPPAEALPASERALLERALAADGGAAARREPTTEDVERVLRRVLELHADEAYERETAAAECALADLSARLGEQPDAAQRLQREARALEAAVHAAVERESAAFAEEAIPRLADALADGGGGGDRATAALESGPE